MKDILSIILTYIQGAPSRVHHQATADTATRITFMYDNLHTLRLTGAVQCFNYFFLRETSSLRFYLENKYNEGC